MGKNVFQLLSETSIMGRNSNKRQQVGRRHVKAKEGIESQVLVFLPPLAALFRLRRAKHVSYSHATSAGDESPAQGAKNGEGERNIFRRHSSNHTRRLMYVYRTLQGRSGCRKNKAGSCQHTPCRHSRVTHTLKHLTYLLFVPRVPLKVSPAIPGSVAGSRRH